MSGIGGDILDVTTPSVGGCAAPLLKIYGLPGLFNSHCWKIIEDDLVKAVHNIFAEGAVKP